MIMRCTVVVTMLASLACALPAAAQESAAAQLAERLYAKDLDQALIPAGYTLLATQPAARSDADERRKLLKSVNVLLERQGGATGKEIAPVVRESVYYYIFESPAVAARFEPTWDDNVAEFGAQLDDSERAKINSSGWKADRRIDVASASGKLTLRCRALDSFISC
jgi:hypothetical protein